jgi:hypothetical protein
MRGEAEMNINIDWQWGRGHRYDLGTASGEQVIRQVGQGRGRIRPLAAQRPLYLEFVALDGTPEACLAFASTWGLLASQPKDGVTEPLSAWRQEIKHLQLLIDRVPGMFRLPHNFAPITSRWNLNVTKLDLVLVSGDPGQHPTLMIQPTTLLGAMLVQFAQAQAGGTSVRECVQCGKRFEVGGRGRKRSGAEYCSPACRYAAFYERNRA